MSEHLAKLLDRLLRRGDQARVVLLDEHGQPTGQTSPWMAHDRAELLGSELPFTRYASGRPAYRVERRWLP